MTLYERIKDMTLEEMKNFIYWVYLCGNKDGAEGLQDCPSGYFGGYVLTLDAEKAIPGGEINSLFDMIG